jgi:molecular chaperone GrpE (heat shock protein)
MLAELAAANAAFGVIKQTVMNGKDLASAAHSIGEYIGIKEKLEKQGHKKKNSFWSAFKGQGSNDLDEFMALEKIKEQEHELKELMMLYGRYHLWDDWQRFQGEMRKKRREAEEKSRKKRKQIIEGILLTVLIIVGLGGLALVVWFAIFLKGL